MPKKNKTIFQDVPKFIMTISLIVGIGAVMGIVSYVVKYEPEINSRSVGEKNIKQEVKAVTADWKTYESKKYGFYVKYPANWIVRSNDFKGGQVFFDDTSGGDNLTTVIMGSLSSFDNERGRTITFGEMSSDIKKGLLEQQADAGDVKENETNIDGMRALNMSLIRDGKYLDSYFLLRGDEVFIITCGTDNLENNVCKSIFDDLLLSFKFIEKSKPAFLGVNFKEVPVLTEDDRIKVGLPKDLDYGALIISDKLIDDLDWMPQSIGDGIVKGSPAEIADLQAGDVILEVNGERVVELEGIMEKYSSGNKIVLKVLRNGEQIEAEVTLAEFPESLINR